MKYVLIWWALSNPSNIQMQEFGSQYACEQAGNAIGEKYDVRPYPNDPNFQILNVKNPNNDIYYKCVPYGSED